MALSFFALAPYVTFESARSRLGDAAPSPFPVGIRMAAASLLITPPPSLAQRRTGQTLGSSPVFADMTQTLRCTHLSAVLLVGLVIAAVAVKEGWESWRGEACGCGPATGPAANLPTDRLGPDQCACGGACTDECCTPTDASQVHGAEREGRCLMGAGHSHVMDTGGCTANACSPSVVSPSPFWSSRSSAA